MIYKHDFEVSFRDIGKSNFVTNKALLSFMEDIAGMHSNSVNFGLNDIKKTNYTWVLLNWKVRVFKRPLYASTIHVETWGRNATKLYTFRDFKMYDDNNELVAIATSKWVLLNASTMSLEKLKPEILEKYGMEDIKVFENEPEIDKLSIPQNYENVHCYTVQRRDIDINNHMHNSIFLDLAYEILPDDVYDNCSFNNFEIMYKKEVKLGNIVKCFYSKVDDYHYITIKSEDEKFLHAIIKLQK